MSTDPTPVLSTTGPPSADAGAPPPATRRVSGNDVHLWRVRLDQPADRVAQLARTLSSDEQTRAARFRFERDRNRFVVGRGLLRVILGGCLDSSPAQLRFAYGLHGKPALVPGGNVDGLRFNLAHSDGVAVYAVTRNREVGIDVERVRPLTDMHLVAARAFSVRECAELRALPPHLQAPAFFNCWTRKEAFLKAVGEGVATAVRRVEVSLAPGEPARLLSVDHDPACADAWTLLDLDAAPGFAAALAVHGAIPRLIRHYDRNGEHRIHLTAKGAGLTADNVLHLVEPTLAKGIG